MNALDEQITAESTEEHAVLETILAVLLRPDFPAQKIDDAMLLVRRRLEFLRCRQGSKNAQPGDVGEPGQWHDVSAGGRCRERKVSGPSEGLVGDSPAMRSVHEAIRRVSHSQATVLLRGESGTGKELVARAIHLQGPRAEKPFVPLHCAAVSDALLESELFGHERGAFTGAVEARKGRFELAEDGTLFLDEIGDIPLATQVKLLRVLQEKCFERVGGSRTISVDVRVISATHRDLEGMVRMGTFREDLYYRLNVVPISLPPLREREGDVPLLIDCFLSRVSQANRRQVRFGRDLLALMMRYHWPGNVRELQNCVERLVVMANPGHDLITWDTIPASLRGYFGDMKQVTGGGAYFTRPSQTSFHPPSPKLAKTSSFPIDAPLPGHGAGRGEREGHPLSVSLQEIERDRLVDALRRTGWNQAKAARALGLTPRQVAYKMRKYGIEEPGEERREE